MAVCFEKKFPFDPEGNFKDVEIEAKNGDLGLGNGHGSKRSFFVTEDFAEEDGELQCTIIKKLLIQMYCHCLDYRNWSSPLETFMKARRQGW